MNKKDELCKRARSLWLSLDCNLIEVEKIYREAWNKSSDFTTTTKKQRVSCNEAGEKLALILLQSGRAEEANQILKVLGYTCRLAEIVFNYPTNESIATDKISSDIQSPPCRIYDDFFRKKDLEILSSVFQDPKASYWEGHNYQVEPPSPYFSYLIPLIGSESEYGFVGELVRRIQKQVSEWRPAVLKATYCEMWAHNRPHASGHQLHFDSDNEGAGGIRNPIVSTVVYLTDTGAPSLITNQRLISRSLADQGWMILPGKNRLAVFDGKVLHGVIPGKGESRSHRVTVMFAFWKEIQVRDGDHPGAARLFPLDNRDWSQKLREAKRVDECAADNNLTTTINSRPIHLNKVYETLDGEPWKRMMGLPDYGQVFQGF